MVQDPGSNRFCTELGKARPLVECHSGGEQTGDDGGLIWKKTILRDMHI